MSSNNFVLSKNVTEDPRGKEFKIWKPFLLKETVLPLMQGTGPICLLLLQYSQYVRINLPLFSTVVPAIIFIFLSCRPFVAITTLSQDLLIMLL